MVRHITDICIPVQLSFQIPCPDEVKGVMHPLAGRFFPIRIKILGCQDLWRDTAVLTAFSPWTFWVFSVKWYFWILVGVSFLVKTLLSSDKFLFCSLWKWGKCMCYTADTDCLPATILLRTCILMSIWTLNVQQHWIQTFKLHHHLE